MSPELMHIYQHLANGECLNGAALAEELGITRAAIWKRIRALRQLGLAIGGSAGEGYRLAQPIEPLNASLIAAEITHAGVDLQVAGAVASTNRQLIGQGTPHATALVAEAQTAGRGRRGRGWSSPLGGGVYLSLGWRFESGLAGLAPLSLVVGVTAAGLLRGLGPAAVQVKWPNDLVIDNAKLGGCLVEVSGAAEGPCRAVVGCGINLIAPDPATIDQPCTGLMVHGCPIGRNVLAGRLIDALARALATFDRTGFAPFHGQWNRLDALRDRRVRVERAQDETIDGVAAGVDSSGRLLIRYSAGTLPIAGGEVSVRAD